MVYKKKQYILKPLFDITKGKSAGLNQKNLKSLKLVCYSMGLVFFKMVGPFLTLSISLINLTAMYYAYINFNVNYNLIIHFLWAIYFNFVFSQMIYSLIITLGVVIAYSLYIKYQFRQINNMFKSNSLAMIKLAMSFHHDICSELQEINKLLTIILPLFLLAITFAWDLAFYLTLYGHNAMLRIVMANCSVWILFGVFFSLCASAIFISEAHRPYKIINSMIVKRKKPLGVKMKWKVSLSILIKILYSNSTNLASKNLKKYVQKKIGSNYTSM